MWVRVQENSKEVKKWGFEMACFIGFYTEDGLLNFRGEVRKSTFVLKYIQKVNSSHQKDFLTSAWKLGSPPLYGNTIQRSIRLTIFLPSWVFGVWGSGAKILI